MFSRKKQPAKPKSQSRQGRNLSQYGLFDIPDINNVGEMDGMDDEDDDDLEAELLAITGEAGAQQKPKRAPAPPAALPGANLDLMIAASLRDIPSDESVSGDDDDPDLLEELSAIASGDERGGKVEVPTIPSGGGGASQLTVLRERLAMYQEAEANAKATGESARARRFTRGIKTLNDMLKQANAGHPISEEDIPPPVSVKKTEPKSPSSEVKEERPLPLPLSSPEEPAPPMRPAPPPPIPPRGAHMGVALPGLTSQTSFPETPTSPPPQVSSDEPSPTSPPPELPSSPKKLCPEPVAILPPTDDTDDSTMSLLLNRRDEYKRAALEAKKSGDTITAINYIKIAKQFDAVISGLKAGQPVDLSAMPPPPSALTVTVSSQPAPDRSRRSSQTQQSGDPEPGILPAASSADLEPPVAEEFVVELPGSVLEALEQRLSKYKSQEDAAKNEGNSSKARRMGRIVKQYADAIKLHKAGKPIPVDELPTPPGYPPIPVEGGAKPPPSPQPATKPSSQPTPSPAPTPDTPTPTPPKAVVQPVSPQASTSSDPSPDKPNVRKMGGSHQEKQLQQLLEKQKQFKLAAVQAKKKGEVNQAKEYLRIAKGFDKLIEASNCGLPVDMSTLPVPPSAKIALETDFDIVSADDCAPPSPAGSEDDILEKLEKDLIDQMKISQNANETEQLK